MIPMDVYLSRNALIQLETLRILSERGEGLLNGHKRGRRHFVEHILPAGGALSASPEILRRLQDLLQESFLGFFIFDSGENQRQVTWGPSAMGKVFLEIVGPPGSKPRFRASVIDFDGTFRLVPLRIIKAG